MERVLGKAPCDFCLERQKHRWSKPSAAAYVLMYQVLGAALVQIIHITHARVVLDEVDVGVGVGEVVGMGGGIGSIGGFNAHT